MKLKKIEDVEAFKKVIAQCDGKVTLNSVQGDVYNLKSSLMQYVALALLITGEGDNLDLFCENKQDEGKIMEFFYEHPNVLK